jgi:anti-anti-sigma factor
VVDVQVLALHGEIDISQKQWVEQEIAQIERFGPNTITILDLNGVGYFDTTLLNALVQVQKRMDAARSKSRICIVVPPGRNLGRMFTITKLDHKFRLFDGVAAARTYAEDAVFA